MGHLCIQIRTHKWLHSNIQKLTLESGKVIKVWAKHCGILCTINNINYYNMHTNQYLINIPLMFLNIIQTPHFCQPIRKI